MGSASALLLRPQRFLGFGLEEYRLGGEGCRFEVGRKGSEGKGKNRGTWPKKGEIGMRVLG